MKSRRTIAIVWLVAALVGAAIVIWALRAQRGHEVTISYSKFLQQVQAGCVADVKITAGSIGAETASVRLKDGTTFETLLPLDYSVALKAMQQAAVNVEIQDASTSPMHFVINAAPFLILLAIWIYFMTIGRPLLGR